MNTILKTLWLAILLSVATIASAQKSEYIVKDIKGSIDYKLKATDEWKQVKRLTPLSKSAILNFADGSEMTVYSTTNPQPLRIIGAGEKRLRTLITEAETKAAKSRGNELAHILKGQGEQTKTLRSGTSYRGQEDDANLLSLYNALISPDSSGNASITLNLIKDEEGNYNVELTNNSDTDMATAVIINIADTYSALSISDDPTNPGLLILPAGMKLIVPECTVIDIDGMKAFAVASYEEFSPQTLCVLLNSRKVENNDGPDNGAVAVEGAVL